MKLSKRDADRAERAVYRAIDAVEVLRELGFGGNEIERSLEHLRILENRVQDSRTK